jgi:protein TonB
MPLVRTGIAGALVLFAACAAPPPPPSPAALCPSLITTPAAVADTHTYDSTSVSKRPERISSPPFRYPDALLNAGLDGRVVVELVIDPDGYPLADSMRLISASHPLFVPPALDVLRKSRFCPAERDGQRVRARIALPLNFTIRRASK